MIFQPRDVEFGDQDGLKNDLGASWGPLGTSWRRLGGVLGRLEGVLGPLGGVLDHLGGVLGRLGGVLGRLGGVLEASWMAPRPPQERQTLRLPLNLNQFCITNFHTVRGSAGTRWAV